MHRTIRRTLSTGAMTIGLTVALAGAALAHECVNASTMGRNPGAGAQIVLDEADGVASITRGLENRISRGLVDLETTEGYHGKVGFDMDGDGDADGSTWLVTPASSIPHQAIENGPPCQGITDFDTYFSQCLGGEQ